MTAASRQLDLPIEAAPRDATEFLVRLRELGLRDIQRCRLTANRTVMVSVHRGELRIQRAYLEAPRPVHAAIVDLVGARTRAARALARHTILAFRIPVAAARPRRARARPSLSDRDAQAVARLHAAHADLNTRFFSGTLRPIDIRLSTRMRSRLGHFAPASVTDPSHIAISRRHLRHHGWRPALETLLHEMIHQWQSETGHPLGHGRRFKELASRLGLSDGAERRVPSAETRR